MPKLTCTLLAVLLVGATGCGSATVSSSGKPASAKWVGPTMPSPGGGTVKTVIYYGPWQCNAEYMNRCQRRCTSEGHTLKGCVWINDAYPACYAGRAQWSTVGFDRPYED